MTRPSSTWPAGIGLQARLWIVMVFVLLPAMGYIVVTAVLERGRARSQAQAELLSEAQLAGSAQQQSLAELRRVLALAATLAPVREAAQTSNPLACQASLAQITELYTQTAGLYLWNLKGDPLCADRPVAGLANVGGQLWFRQVLATPNFALGEFEPGSAAGEPTLELGYPVTGSTGELSAVISSRLDLNHLTQAASGLALPTDALVAELDHDGRVLARSKDWAAWLGKPEAPGLSPTLGSGASVSDQTGSDGVRRLYAFTPVTGPGGSLVYLCLGRPSIAVFGPSDTALFTSLLISGGLAILALALAGWWGRQTLVRPMKILLAATDHMTSGDLSARASPEPAGSELDRLASAFNAMAASLQQREAALRRAENSLLETERLARQAARQADQQAQQSQARAAQLETTAAGLSQAISPSEVIRVILHQGAGAVGATAASLLVLSDDGARLARAAEVGYSDQIGRLFQQFPVSSPLPAADVVRTGEAVWLESSAAYRARYPQLTDIINSADYEAAAAIPLRYAGRITGVLALSFPTTRIFGSDVQSYLLTLASFGAQALERIRLLEETQRHR